MKSCNVVLGGPMNFLGKRRNFVAGCCKLVKNVTNIIQYFYFTRVAVGREESIRGQHHPVQFKSYKVYKCDWFGCGNVISWRPSYTCIFGPCE